MLTKEQITIALTRLGELACKQNETIDLLIVGGAALVLAYEARQSTHDVDVIILSPNRDLVRTLAREVATELGLNKKWFSDAARIFVTDRRADMILLATPGLVVARPAIAHLLAMKLLAWRDEIDQSDAQRLLEELLKEQVSRSLPTDREHIWKMIEPYISSNLRVKYAQAHFDDLWKE
ncbi:MAG: nucleotidyltransferase [Ardenticatenaceae bacterium]